jgi:diguanylate cyclase (GGDEF)-like protein
MDRAIAALRAEYLRASPVRLDEIAALLAGLSARPSDRASLERTMRHFHALAGSGSTYGMPAVTEVARAADEEIRDLLDGGHDPDPGQLARWGDALARLRDEFFLRSPEKPLMRLRHDHRSGDTPGRTVLLAVQDSGLREDLQRSLMEDGYSVRLAGSRKDALALLKGGLPQAIVTEMELPDGPGLDLVEHVRSWPGGDRVAAFALGGASRFPEKVTALYTGADGFFEKPLDILALKRRLSQFVRDTCHPEGPKVLSVDDDPDQAAFIRAVLEAGGFEVSTCTDPMRFEEEMVAFQPDLVLMDANMPGLNGYGLTRYLRAEERYVTLPVVFLTAEAEERAKIEVIRSGGDDLLVKPVTPGLLLNTVALRIERSRFLKGLLYRDGLTQLYTWTAFMERARIAFAMGLRRGDGRVALALLDMDGFKGVNDRYGHMTGDRVLASFATVLRRRLRQADTAGRLGGDEFAVIIEDLGASDALRLLDLFVQNFGSTEHASVAGDAFSISCSAGVAMLDPGSMDLGSWLGAADEALYRAKADGGGRVVLHPGASPESPHEST